MNATELQTAVDADLVVRGARKGRLPVTDYDEAYDVMEELAPGAYKPDSVLESHLRANWGDIIAGRGAVPVTGSPTLGTLGTARASSVEEADRLLETFPLLHFQVCTEIRDKNSSFQRPVPNILQSRMDEAYVLCTYILLCACRMLVLKPRQVGCSTFAAYLCYHHARRVPGNVLMMADVNKRTDKLWTIFNDYSDHDVFPWRCKYDYNTERGTMQHPGGVTAEIERDTAMDSKSGRGGTRSAILYSEVAHYAKSGVAQDSMLIGASMASLVKGPGSLAIAETTADGASGYFHDQWQGAVCCDDFAAGRRGNGWIKVFAAWFEFTIAMLDGHKERFQPEELKAVQDAPTTREKRLMELYGNDGPQGFRLGKTNREDTAWEQLAWRRRTIDGPICAGNEALFDQEYPEDEQTAFLSSGSPRFDPTGVGRLEILVKTEFRARRGILEEQNGKVNWFPSVDNAWLWVLEPPTEGEAYLGWLDPMTGEQATGSKDTDYHAFGIWKAGRMRDGQFIPHELVCTIDVPQGCRWKDDDLLTERIARVLKWYGNCMIVPEVNVAVNIPNDLRRRGCTIYHRQKFDQFNPGQTVNVMGWKTTPGAGGTRRILVNAIATAIREGTVNVRYKPFVDEMRNFITDEHGVDRAKNGTHDDWIMGGGMGLACISYAQVYRNPLQRRQAPRLAGAAS